MFMPANEVPEELDGDARRDLGRKLAQVRREAGFTQQGLAALIGYARGTVSSAEVGRLDQSAQFWELCDAALRANGQLSHRYEWIRQCDAQERESSAKAKRDRHLRDLARMQERTRPGPSRGEIPGGNIHMRLTDEDGVTQYLLIPLSATSPELLAETLRGILR